MSKSENAPLSASILRIEGDDAPAFAQAQFASDVRALEPHHWQWSAWLDARGRIRALFQIARTDTHQLLLLLRGGDAARMAENLRPYVFRSRLQLTPLEGGAVGDAQSMQPFEARSDPSELLLGHQDYSLRIPASNASCNWRLAAIRAGHPWLPESLQDRFLPPALSLRRLDAISLGKGCFPGQEIAARLHYRGGHKHGLFHLALPAASAPASTLTLDTDDRDEIVILDCARSETGHEALVVMHERMAGILPHADAEPVPGLPVLLKAFPA